MVALVGSRAGSDFDRHLRCLLPVGGATIEREQIAMMTGRRQRRVWSGVTELSRCNGPVTQPLSCSHSKSLYCPSEQRTVLLLLSAFLDLVIRVVVVVFQCDAYRGIV